MKGSKQVCIGWPARRWLVVLLAAFLQSGAFADDSDSPLVISGSSWITDAPTRIADSAGYFEGAAGARIVVELADSGKQSLERLMAGEADFALMASVPLAMELLRLDAEGLPHEQWPVVLASVGLSNKTHHVIADRRRGIEQPGDLEGRSVGVLLNSSAHYGWDRFAQFNRVDPDAVRLVDTRPDLLADGLTDGRFDAVVTWTPYSDRILGQLGANARVFALDSMDSVSWLLVSTRGVVAAYPDQVERVLAGYTRAIDLLHSDPSRAAALVGREVEWLRSGRVAWKLALDWPVLANIEQKLNWSAVRLGLERPRLRPHHYIDREPMERFRPSAVTLPLWLPAGQDAR